LTGAYTGIDKIRDTPIVAGKQSFKLSDIAEVTRGYEDPATFVIRHNGESSLLLSVVMKEGWNGLDLGDALRAESDKISSSLPLGVSLKKITDQAVNISSEVRCLQLAGKKETRRSQSSSTALPVSTGAANQ
jgi:multidrug efflux pump subunit AcrB